MNYTEIEIGADFVLGDFLKSLSLKNISYQNAKVLGGKLMIEIDSDVESFQDTFNEIEGDTASKDLMAIASLYVELEREGKIYASLMNARLVALRKALLNNGLSNSVVRNVARKVRGLTEKTRVQINAGQWLSAKDEADLMLPDENLQSLVDTYSIPLNQALIISEIKDKIQQVIDTMYPKGVE